MGVGEGTYEPNTCEVELILDKVGRSSRGFFFNLLITSIAILVILDSILDGILDDILDGILSGILGDILGGILNSILGGILGGILSCLLFHGSDHSLAQLFLLFLNVLTNHEENSLKLILQLEWKLIFAITKVTTAIQFRKHVNRSATAPSTGYFNGLKLLSSVSTSLN